MSFNDNNNLRLLWEIICESVIVNEKSNEQQKNIYDIFTTHLNTFRNSNNAEINLMSKNKTFISEVLKIIQQNESRNLEKNIKLNKMMFSNMVTSQDIKDTRKVKFEESLKQHQNNFNEFSNSSAPAQIDFRLPMDEEPLLDASQLVNKLVSERNYESELKMIPNNPDSKLLGQNNISNPDYNLNNNIKILTIEKEEYSSIDKIADINKLLPLQPEREKTEFDMLNNNIIILNSSILKLIEVLNNNTNDEDSA